MDPPQSFPTFPHTNNSCRSRSLICIVIFSTTGRRPGGLPNPSRWAAYPWPGATRSSTVSPFPPWSLGCDPRRSRGKAWLPVLDATNNCLPLSCSPQLPYNCTAAPLVSAHPKSWGLWGLCERQGKTATTAAASSSNTKPRRLRSPPRRQCGRQLEEKGGGKKIEGSAQDRSDGGVAPAFLSSSFPYLSSRMKKKPTYSPKDAAENCGVEVARRKGRKGTGREGGMEGEVGSMVVGSRQKIWQRSFFFWLLFFCFFTAVILSLPISQQKKNERGVGGGVPCCSEVRLGLPGFSEPCPICEAPAKSLPSLNNLVGGVPLSLPPLLPPSFSLSPTLTVHFLHSLPFSLPLPLSPSPLLPIHQQRAVTLPSKTPDSGRTKDHYSMV